MVWRPEPALVIDQGFLLALRLLPPCQELGLFSRCWSGSPRSISELCGEVDGVGALALGDEPELFPA